MLAAFTNSNGDLVQVERFFLTPDGRKANIEKPKQFMPGWKVGIMRGSSVKLYPPGETLAISEGVETALAFYSQFKVPVWGAGNTALMECIVIPDTVRRVVILVDNDLSGAGQKAADFLCERMIKEGREVEMLKPDEPGTDFADLFTKQVIPNE